MSRNTSAGFRRLPRIADLMTTELDACVERSRLAERAGDASAALEWLEAVPVFRRGRHRAILAGLRQLDDELPEWVWARWIVYQSFRCEDGDTGAMNRRFAHAVMDSVHQDALEACFESAGDPVKVLAHTMGESWVYHQLAAFEGGGIASFVEEFATGRLAEHADLAREWATAPLGGYQLGDGLPGGRVLVLDLQRQETLEVLDLGARSGSSDGWVLGRLVGSGLGDTLMFDAPPLAVPERLARRVADPGAHWIDHVVRAVWRGRLGTAELWREDYELTTDVMELDLLRFGTPTRDHARVMQQLRAGRDEVGRAAYRILERTRRGEVDVADHPYVGAAVLNVHAFAEMRRHAHGPSGAGELAAWSGRLAEPAASRMRALVHP